MSKNPLFRSGEENEKVIRNPQADPDHHQKLTTSRRSPLANVCQVWSTSVSAFVSYPVYRMTEWETERSHNLRLVAGPTNAENKQKTNRQTDKQTDRETDKNETSAGYPGGDVVINIILIWYDLADDKQGRWALSYYTDRQHHGGFYQTWLMTFATDDNSLDSFN